MKTALLLLSSLWLLAGCSGIDATIDAEPVSGPVQFHPRADPDRVILFLSPNHVPPGYKVLARLRSIGGYGTREQLIRALRLKAAQCGADGMILLKVGTRRTDIGVEPVPTTPNDLSPETQMAPVTYSDADIYISSEPRVVFEGDALAVRLRR